MLGFLWYNHSSKMEVVVGTYDPLLLGFELVHDNNNKNKYRFEPKFVDKGHAGCVKSVMCGGSGEGLLASASTDETIRLYSLKDHKDLGSLHQHEGSVTCLTFCGSTHMLSASEDKTICVWNCKTWECLKVLKGHYGPVYSVSVHPSGRLAMSVSKDKHLRTWNLVTGRSAYVTNLKEVATLIKWSPKGDCYAVVIGNKIVIYKLATASLSCTLELPRPVLAVQFISETLLVAGGEFDGIRILDIEKEDCIQTLEGHESRVKALEVTDDILTDQDRKNRILVSVSSDGDLRAWSFNQENLEEEALLVARYEMNARPTCLTISCPGRRVQPKRPPEKMEERETEEKKEQQARKKDKSERRTRRQSGDEPTKKKAKKKKKTSKKKKQQQEQEEGQEKSTTKTSEETSEAMSPDDEEDEEEAMEN